MFLRIFVGCSNAEEKRLQPKNIVRKPGLTFSYQEEWMKYNKNVKNNFLTFKAQNQRIDCHPKKTGEGGGLLGWSRKWLFLLTPYA